MLASCCTSTPQEPQAPSEASRPSWLSRTAGIVAADHREFYDTETLLGLGVGVGLAGLSANSQLDRDIYEDVMPEWRTDELGEFRDTVLPLGDGAYMLPTLAAASWLGPALGSEAVGAWGERSLRAITVGVPPMLALQRLTGARRPDDIGSTTSSEWEAFGHTNGVSGHAFIGSIPFLTVARMQDDPWIDGACYLGSTLVAAARLQGSRHYFSQVALGWWIGFLATGAVDDAEAGMTPATGVATSFLPFVGDDEVGFYVTHRF